MSNQVSKEEFDSIKKQLAKVTKLIKKRKADELEESGQELEEDDGRVHGELVIPNPQGIEGHNFLVQLIAKVPIKLREKIWDFNYVDFVLLIPEIEKPTEVPITLFKTADESFQFKQGKQTKRISKLQVWLQAFSVYSAVLMARWPNRGPELFQYQAKIFNLADQQF